MHKGTAPEQASLLDVLIDGFEKNEVLDGWHWRELPVPDAAVAAVRFAAFTEEATRWKGPPTRLAAEGPRRIAAWPDLEIRQVGRGVLVRVRPPRFNWWHDAETWDGDPMGPVHDWCDEESSRPVR